MPGLGAIDTVLTLEPQLVAPSHTRARSAPARLPKGGPGAAASPPGRATTSAPATPPPVEAGPRSLPRLSRPRGS